MALALHQIYKKAADPPGRIKWIDGLNSGMMTGDPSALHGLLGGQRTVEQFISDFKGAFGG